MRRGAVFVAWVVMAAGVPDASADQSVTVVEDHFASGTTRTLTVQLPDRAPVAARRGSLVGPARSLAVVLINFSDRDLEPMTAAEARQAVFTAPDSGNAFWIDNSAGGISFAGLNNSEGDVFGWYTLAAGSTPCDLDAWSSQGRQAAIDGGVDIDAYDHVMFMYPAAPECAGAAYGQVGGRYTWVPASFTGAVAHELGHNLGFHHSNGYDCVDGAGNRVAFSDNCTNVEYADPADVMGGGVFHNHAHYKERLGLVPDATTVDEGTFGLAPVEFNPSPPAVRILRDSPGGVDRYYYVEYRRPKARFGVDCEMGGRVLIRLVTPSDPNLKPHLIDTTPETASFLDAGLALGETFTDPAAGISIRTIEAGPNGAQVAVSRSGALPPAESPATDGSGWMNLRAEFFANRDLMGSPVHSMDLDSLAFDWKLASPGGTVPSDDFSMRATGTLLVAESGEYDLSLRSDDGVRMFVDGTMVVDDWVFRGATESWATVALEAGVPHEVVIEYFEAGGDASARFGWASDSTTCATTGPTTLELPPDDFEEPDDGGEDSPDGPGAGGDIHGSLGCSAGGSALPLWPALLVLALIGRLRLGT